MRPTATPCNSSGNHGRRDCQAHYVIQSGDRRVALLAHEGWHDYAPLQLRCACGRVPCHRYDAGWIDAAGHEAGEPALERRQNNAPPEQTHKAQPPAPLKSILPTIASSFAQCKTETMPIL